MGYISSINFKKSNTIQTRHNDRDLPPSYLIGADREVNHTHKNALILKNQMIKNAIEAYTKHRGQKFQAKSYEWSAVCNIKPETTMQDLEQLAKHFNEKYGFQCYQIAIHRDEGHINEQGQKEINHHAHLEFITLDKETGKNNYRRELITPSVLRQIQTEVAQILQMQRGEDKRKTKRKRIEPRQYAQMKEEEKRKIKELKQKHSQRENHTLNELDKLLEIDTTQMNLNEAFTAHKNKILSIKETKERLEIEINQTLTQKEIKDYVEAFRKQSIGKGYPKEFFRELSNLKQNTKEATLEDLKNTIEDLAQSYEREKTKREELEQELEKLKKREKELRQENENLKNKIKELESKINSIESDLKAKEQKKEENYQENKQIDLRGNSEPLNDTSEEDVLKHKQNLDYLLEQTKAHQAEANAMLEDNNIEQRTSQEVEKEFEETFKRLHR